MVKLTNATMCFTFLAVFLPFVGIRSMKSEATLFRKEFTPRIPNSAELFEILKGTDMCVTIHLTQESNISLHDYKVDNNSSTSLINTTMKTLSTKSSLEFAVYMNDFNPILSSLVTRMKQLPQQWKGIAKAAFRVLVDISLPPFVKGFQTYFPTDTSMNSCQWKYHLTFTKSFSTLIDSRVNEFLQSAHAPTCQPMPLSEKPSEISTGCSWWGWTSHCLSLATQLRKQWNGIKKAAVRMFADHHSTYESLEYNFHEHCYDVEDEGYDQGPALSGVDVLQAYLSFEIDATYFFASETTTNATDYIHLGRSVSLPMTMRALRDIVAVKVPACAKAQLLRLLQSSLHYITPPRLCLFAGTLIVALCNLVLVACRWFFRRLVGLIAATYRIGFNGIVRHVRNQMIRQVQGRNRGGVNVRRRSDGTRVMEESTVRRHNDSVNMSIENSPYLNDTEPTLDIVFRFNCCILQFSLETYDWQEKACGLLEVFEDTSNEHIRIVSSSLQLDEELFSAVRNPGENTFVLNGVIGLALSAEDAMDFQEYIVDSYDCLITE